MANGFDKILHNRLEADPDKVVKYAHSYVRDLQYEGKEPSPRMAFALSAIVQKVEPDNYLVEKLKDGLFKQYSEELRLLLLSHSEGVV